MMHSQGQSEQRTAVKDSDMRAFGIGLPLAAELRRGHWNHLAIDPSWDGRLIPIPIAIPKEYVELRNNDAYPAIIGQNRWGNGSNNRLLRCTSSGITHAD